MRPWRSSIQAATYPLVYHNRWRVRNVAFDSVGVVRQTPSVRVIRMNGLNDRCRSVRIVLV